MKWWRLTLRDLSGLWGPCRTARKTGERDRNLLALLHCYVKRLAAPLFYLQILSLIIKPPHIFCTRPSPAQLPVKSIKKPLDCSSTPSHLFLPMHTHTWNFVCPLWIYSIWTTRLRTYLPYTYICMNICWSWYHATLLLSSTRTLRLNIWQ